MAEGLRVEALSAGYGDARVLNNVSFTLDKGESLALLGRNGVGKTTLVDTLIGVTTRHDGRISLGGVDLTMLPPHARARRGVGWTPQERNIFRSLTVEENLTAFATPGPWTPARVFEMFPRLAERRRNGGRQLSGGEQQMLAIGRALVLNPSLLLLDEPTEGLAPIIVDELLAALRRLAREGLSMIIVEQKPKKVLPFTERAIILDRGAIVHSARSADLIDNPAALEAHLAAAN
ncbi:MAG: ABC transporter ATP-binding protein [Hyphomicrobiales bacterium]|nr:ABC transporter ATP-binding protein [Hyphomicrobiales bacterium]